MSLILSWAVWQGSKAATLVLMRYANTLLTLLQLAHTDTPQLDLQDLELDDDATDSEDEEEIDDDDDPIEAERKNRARAAEKLKRRAGEPKKPTIEEIKKLHPSFLTMLRSVLAK